MSSEKRGLECLEVSLEGVGCEGQDLSEWGQVVPFHKKKLKVGGVVRCMGREGCSASEDQAWSPSRLGWGVVRSSRGPSVGFISLAHA